MTEAMNAYFALHGDHPAEPYIVTSLCGCRTVYPTRAGIAAYYPCRCCDAIARREMDAVQQRRYAMAGEPWPREGR